MKNFFIFLLFFLTVLLSFAEDTVWIYSTTDLHGHLFSSAARPNIRKLIHVIREDISRTGKGRSLLIDCGDLIQGSWESQSDKGETVIQWMNYAGFDVWVPGNHDFEFGLKTLFQRAGEFRGDVLCANLRTKEKSSFPAWKLFRRNGLSIAVIGMTSEHIVNWNWKPEEQGIEIRKTIRSLMDAMSEIRKVKPDLIILAIHAGRFQSARFAPEWQMYNLAARFPEIDLILGGHTHEAAAGFPLEKNVWYAQAGKHADGYLKVKIVYDKEKKKRMTLTSAFHKIQEDAGNENCSDPDLKRKTDSLRKAMYSQVCGNGPVVSLDTPEKTARLFCNAIAEKTKAKIVFHGILSRAEKHKGKYSRKDVFDLCPFENTVVLLKLSPSECKQILTEQAAGKRKKNNMFQFCSGMEVDSKGNLKFPDGRIWKEESERIPVAFNSFIASSAGMRFPVLKAIAMKKEVDGKDTGFLVRDLLEEYLRRNYR